MKIEVDIDTTLIREIKGSYDMRGKTFKSYMPEFKEFAVALAYKIGDKEASEELGLRETAIPEWRSKLKWERIGKENRMKFLEDTIKDLRQEISNLKSENRNLRQHISDNYIASILQN